MVAHSCNPRNQELETGQPGIHETLSQNQDKRKRQGCGLSVPDEYILLWAVGPMAEVYRLKMES